VSNLHEALNRYFFLIIKTQPLTKQQQKNLTVKLGEWSEEFSEVDIPNNNDAPRFNYWHADGVFHDPPCRYSILHMASLSPENGRTQFMNNIKALESMPNGLRELMKGKTVVHSLRSSSVDLGPYNNLSHETRLPLIYLNTNCNVETLHYNLNLWRSLEGESQETSDEIKRELKEYLDTISTPSHTGIFYEYKWDEGDTVICNSQIMAHRAGPGIVSKRRIERALAFGPLPM